MAGVEKDDDENAVDTLLGGAAAQAQTGDKNSNSNRASFKQ